MPLGRAMTLLAAAIQALKWSVLGEIGSRLIGPVVFILLARFLMPEDFGVLAAAMVAVSFSQVFWDSGLARALIQRSDDEAISADAVLWLNLALSVVLMFALFMTAPAIAAFFGDARISTVLRVLSLQLPVASACAVMTALMYKRLEFRRLFWVRLVTTGGPGLASIPLALGGWGYWALVAGVLVGQVLQLAALWHFAGWRVKRRIDADRARQLLQFGKWSIASGMLGWAYGWLDAIVVGHFLGTRDMGLYRTGNTFVTIVFGLVFSPLLPVLYSTFSRAQHDLVRLRRVLMIVAHAIALISLPIGLALVSMREDLGSLVFGPGWSGVDAVIACLGLSHAIGWIAGANGELYRAVGRPQVEAMTMSMMLVCYVPIYLLAVQRGLEAFLWARVALSVVALIAHVMICWWAVAIHPRKWLRACAVAAPTAAFSAWVSLLIDFNDYMPVTRILLMILVGGSVYGFLIMILEQRFLRELTLIFRVNSAAQKGEVRPW
jgi:PST family polysaccharide transporter